MSGIPSPHQRGAGENPAGFNTPNQEGRLGPQGPPGYPPPGVTPTPAGSTNLSTLPGINTLTGVPGNSFGVVRPPQFFQPIATSLQGLQQPPPRPPQVLEPPPLLPPGFLGPPTRQPTLNSVVVGMTSNGDPWFAVPARGLAWARARADRANKGADVASACLRMIEIKRQFQQG